MRWLSKIVRAKGNIFRAVWLIPIIVLGYVGWMNLVPLGATTSYFIDVGGEDTDGNAKVTEPFDRISDSKEAGGTNFRELEANLAYSELGTYLLEDAYEVGIRVRFKDNFPGDAKFALGARDKEEWSYYWKDIYVPFYGQLADLPTVVENGNIKVYAIEEESATNFESVNEFQKKPPLGLVIARNDKSLKITQRVSPEECGGIDTAEFATGDAFPIPLAADVDQNGSFETGTSLRESHTFYFFATGDTLKLEITKRDLNWYEGSDLLDVLIYSLDGALKAQGAILDDGDITGSKNLGDPQHLTLSVDNLERGSYRLVLKQTGVGSDFLITHLGLNQAKLVTLRRVFLAGNIYLGGELQPMVVWCYLFNEGEINFQTPHGSALQTITVDGEDYSQIIKIDAIGTSFSTGLLKSGIYQIKAEKGDVSMETPEGYFAFTEDSLFIPVSSSNREENGSLLINTTLRGRHTVWTYVNNGSLRLEITKQDLNWYEGEDELRIEVYSFDGELRGSTIIPDDSNDRNSKQLGPLQSKSLVIQDLESGAYRIELETGGDLLIRKLEINQEKLVSNMVFLVGMNPVYFKDGLAFDPVRLYGKNFKADKLKFQTLHSPGLQRITIQGDGIDTTVDVNELETDFSINFRSGAYQLTVPNQDIGIESNGYLSLTSNSFFLPKRCEVIDLRYDLSWARQNADYMIIDYKDYIVPVEDDGWLIAQTSWKREDLFIKDNKLSFCLSARHLDREPASTVPVDWIEITVKTLPIWKRLGWVD